VQTLGGVRQYLTGYQSAKAARINARIQEARATQQRTAEDERTAYDRYRWSEAHRIFESLPPTEQEDIETVTRSGLTSFNGSLGKAMFDRKRDLLTMQRHGEQIASFEDWKVTQ
jgi:molybdenum cofactor biosynthesis enzyme MoaA